MGLSGTLDARGARILDLGLCFYGYDMPHAEPESLEPLPTVRDVDSTQTAATRAMSPAEHSSARSLLQQIGRYQIIRKIGEGGMGSVYEAVQEKPRRRVALKVIRFGCASAQALRRFELEANVLGRLQHPGIAQVYEAGTADAGQGPQPFFAMEFIEGGTLRDYVARNRLGIRQRLELMAKICDAVQHAHERGVIHRDLKPGNILVDATGQPKILDFGIARATDSDVQITTMQTDVGQLIGTVPYMSPEQIAADPRELDIRSDVYALGVITYEMLAGKLPYEVQQKMIHEAARVIREDDPIPLSTVNRVFRGDIETIVAKTLEKDKTRRYGSAAELAADIRRYLNHEPITARPPSTIYQVRKFARRNRALVGGVAAVFLALLIGMIVSTSQYFAAEAARRDAVAARDAAQRDRDRAVAAEKRAEGNFQLARQAVEKYLNRVADDPALKARGLEKLRQQLLGTAKEFYEKFVHQRSDDPALRSDLGDAQTSLANISRLIAETDQAEAAYGKAREVFESLVREQPTNRQYLRQLAATYGDLGLLYSDTRRGKEAEAAFRQSQTVEQELEKLGATEPVDQSRLANTCDNLALYYKNAGRAGDAEAQHKRAMNIRKQLVKQFPENESYREELIRSYNNLTDLYANSGRAAAAEPYLKEAIALCIELARQHPDVPQYQSVLAASYNNIAGVYMLTDQLDAARKAYQLAVPIRERLASEHPAMLEYGLHLGSAYCNLGELETREDKFDAALPWFEKSIATLEGVLRREPRHTTARFYLSYTHSWNGRALGGAGRLDESLAEWDEAIKLDDQNDVSLRVGRAAAAARAGKYAVAARQVDVAATQPALSGETMYGFSEALALSAVAARADASLSEETRERICAADETRALEFLRRAAAGGYFKDSKAVADLRKNAVFAPLRSREEFRAWESEVAGAPAAQGKP